MKEIDGLLYPKLKAPTQKKVELGRFDKMRLNFLKEHHRIIYTNLRTTGKLNDHLLSVDETNELYDRLIEQYKIKWNITEELKEENQMKWVQEMNNVKQCASEYVLKECVYI